jgi:EAL domain-containing protein (putative c-di-GMP-specific phosphodiesterase class I)
VLRIATSLAPPAHTRLRRSLRLSVTGEGIERAEQAAQLQLLGGARGQGFLPLRGPGLIRV